MSLSPDHQDKILKELEELHSKGRSPTTQDECCEVEATCELHPTPSFDIPNAKMWAIYDNTFSPCETAINQLEAGQYVIRHSSERGIYFAKHSIHLDELFILSDSAAEDVIAGIENFWTKEQHFRSFGFLWKRGVLLWGLPGGGKTTTLQIIANNIIKQGGLAIYVDNPSLGAAGLGLLRRIEPTRPIVVMLEDIDAIIKVHGEADLLSLLDGELQIDNIVFVATTNYPELLDKRLINRPSRFDVVKKIGMPSAMARYEYIKHKNPKLSEEELQQWVNATKRFSIAHIKELIVSVECFEVDFNEAVTRLQYMIDVNISSDEYQSDQSGSVGFIP